MIARIEGKLIEKNPAQVIIDCAGIGYQVNITLHTYTTLPESGNCVLHTQQIIREDANLLYGFHNKAEKDMFVLLISVSGVGASSANLILSSMTPSEVASAIIDGDVGLLRSVKGIGNKTAERIIVDLRDKLTKDGLPHISITQGNSLREEALSALMMLGFNKSVAEKGISKALKDSSNGDSVESLVKSVLKGI
jgi:Holliday junction DNA helicase RuvA